MLSDHSLAVLQIHIVQFSIAMFIVALVAIFTARRWPQLTFLLFMIAMAKCLVPPVIASPAGLFTWNSDIALAPSLLDPEQMTLERLKYASHALRRGDLTLADSASLASNLPLDTAGWLQWLNWSWAKCLLAGWTIGIAIVLAKSGARYRQLVKQLQAETGTAPPSFYRMVFELKDKVGLRRDLNVVVSESNMGPGCVGIWRPTLVIPALLVSNLPSQFLRPIVTHELVHARRHDVLWGCLQYAVQVLWWFHPLVWWSGRRASLLCEQCVDEEVVATLRCSPALYAESLIRVLELKKVLRPIPIGQNLSAAEVTSQRLKQLVGRNGRYSSRTPRIAWALVAVFAITALPGMHWRSDNLTAENRLTFNEYCSDIMQFVEARHWEAAESMLRPIVKAEPNCAQAVFFLGFVLHGQGDLEAALEYHHRASAFSEVRPVALYNCACAYALLGKQEDALDYLENALDAGFSHEAELMKDPDLSSLLASNRFKSLCQRLKKNRSKRDGHSIPEFSDVDFWVGQWDVFSPNGLRVGKNLVSRPLDGNILFEEWISESGENQTGFNYVVSDNQQWRQIWIDAQGSVTDLTGTFSGEKLELVGNTYSASGNRTMQRTTVERKNDGVLHQHVESSGDNGQTWKTLFEGLYVRSTNTASGTDSHGMETHRTSSFKSQKQASLRPIASAPMIIGAPKPL